LKLQRTGLGTFKVDMPPDGPIDPMAALSAFIVTEEQVQKMVETEIIWRVVIPSGHVSAWIAPAGAGKTAVATFAASELPALGYRVLYFQEDAGAGDLPAMHEHAKAHGYTLLNSTLGGSQPEAQLASLRLMVESGADLTGFVFIFDTLKKYADLMSKGGTRALFALFRGVTQRGGTVVLLGHTNKHHGPDGKPVFEGVGDVRNDVDELFYLDATEKDAWGRVTITLRPDKSRCEVKPASFTLDTTTMTVRPLDRVIDVHEQLQRKRQEEQDAEAIRAIDECLLRGGMNRTELVDKAAQSCGHGAKAIRKVLDRYSSTEKTPQALWLVTYYRVNNTRHVSRNPLRALPKANPTEPAKRAEPEHEPPTWATEEAGQ
jgi:hypothetical protein